MAANPVLPDAGVDEAPAISTIRTAVPEEKILSLNQRIKRWLYKVFSGHEEFLGWTPD